MRNAIINKQLNFIKRYNNLDDEKLSIIKYGLESIYILITKLVIILLVAFLLGLLKQTIIFLLFYNLVRLPSFGLHATKSWICLISSLLVFIILPYVCTILVIPTNYKLIMGIIGLFFMFKNAPADTYKRPIINKKRRLVYKILSCIITVVMTCISLFIKDQFLASSILISIILQCFMISPTVYKIFKLPYNNYKQYI